MFSLTISFMVIFILGKLTFLGTHLNLIIVMFCSEQVLPCYRAAASLRSLSARVALSCTEHTAFISDLLCHWGPVWRPLGSWTILSLSPLCWPHWGTTTWRGGDCPCLSLDIAFTPTAEQPCLCTGTRTFIKPLCSGMLFYVIIRSSELISLSNLGMGHSNKSAPKTWRIVSQRKCSNTTDLKFGMPVTFSTGTAHLCLCTAQSWGRHTKQCE